MGDERNSRRSRRKKRKREVEEEKRKRHRRSPIHIRTNVDEGTEMDDILTIFFRDYGNNEGGSDNEEIEEIVEEVEVEEVEVEEYIEIDMNKLKTLEDLINLANKYRDINNKDIKVLVTLIEEMNELNEMIGMNDIKEIVVSQILFLIQGLSKKDMMHTVIQGAPGCGKTTFAKILAKIYLKLGHLKSDKFIIASRSDFIAQYLGQTAIKTQRVIDSAKDSVLFIDECYSLGTDTENGDSFSKECIDTLNANLSENRNFVCIIAGYKEDLNRCFFARNAGLRRRFPWTYEIKDISSIELETIFKSMVRKNDWYIDDTEIPKYFFKNNREYFPYNGGSIETFFGKVKMVHSKRVFGKSKTSKMNITRKDMTKALDIHKASIEKKKRNIPPPGLYI